MAALSIWDYADDRVVPKMNAYRAIYPGPQRQNNAPAPGRTERAAIAYAELGRGGSLEEYEAVESTVMNRVASGHPYWTHGKELNEHSVVTTFGQYQAYTGNRRDFDRYLEGAAHDPGAENAMQADENLRRTGRPTTNAVSFIVHQDGSPPSDHEVWNLGNVGRAEPYRAGRAYLYRDLNPPVKKGK